METQSKFHTVYYTLWASNVSFPLSKASSIAFPFYEPSNSFAVLNSYTLSMNYIAGQQKCTLIDSLSICTKH